VDVHSYPQDATCIHLSTTGTHRYPQDATCIHLSTTGIHFASTPPLTRFSAYFVFFAGLEPDFFLIGDGLLLVLANSVGSEGALGLV
jgi:hypothetical protein